MKQTLNLNQVDPVKKQQEVSARDRGAGFSPFDPPSAHTPPSTIKVSYDEFHPFFKKLVDDHIQLTKQLEIFEQNIKKIKMNSELFIELDDEIRGFFTFFEKEFTSHNQKEEKLLFNLLNERFLQIGEHSKTKNPITPIKVLEDEHKVIDRVFTQAEQTWILIHEIFDLKSQKTLIAHFLDKSKELVEAVRLHIFREDEIVFSLGQKNLTNKELDELLIALN